MILRRIISIFFDIAFSILPAIGAHYSGLNFAIYFIFIFILSQIVEILYYKGYTCGMILCKILPINKSDTKISILKSIIYHTFLTLLLVNVFNPQVNIFTKIFLPIALLIPFPQSGKYHSVLDLIFNINWIKKEKIDV